MEAGVSILAGLAALLLIAAWVRVRSPRPEFPPLGTDPDDPLMLPAMAKAQATLVTEHGGFTQRAMLEIARRDSIALPRELRRLEDQYAPADD